MAKVPNGVAYKHCRKF